MKFLFNLISILFILGVIGVAGVFLWAQHHYNKAGMNAEMLEIHVERGSNIGGVADILVNKGVIEQPLIFQIAGRISGKASKIKAGEYEIEVGASMGEILNKLVDGDTLARRFTVREGLTSYEIVRIIKSVEDLSGEIKDIPPEGSLFPSTYDYQRGESREAVVARMAIKMKENLLDACGYLLGTLDWDKIEAMDFEDFKSYSCPEDTEKAQFKGLKPTIGDVLNLAAIVEKETGVAEERRTVAGVFENRLDKGIALQTDPTVIYALTMGRHKNDGKGPLGRRLLSKDLKVDNPYNTYKYPGLPPTPIANPGRAAIDAVIDPEQHDYIYFVADGAGGHVFSKTLAEHNRNVKKWRKIRKKQN
ncbi:MAG: endolytic transglycosylase MltG [Micavibrio sp.]|nr:endolytic transglycosylase MltG [Micavibrio sp.]